VNPATLVRWALGVALASLVATPALAGGADPQCEGGKLAAAGRYAGCRLAAEAAALKGGGPAGFSKCEAGLEKAWSSSEARSSACATSDDLDAIRDALTLETDRCAFWLSGEAGLRAARTPATGQTASFPVDKNDGSSLLMTVPDDGLLQAGRARRFQDNGDGTITDLVTGLMWEKKGNLPGGLHYVWDWYTWSSNGETIWDWLDHVNAEGGTGFAGYDDWRIPNIRELLTLADYSRQFPAVDPIFADVGCNTAVCPPSGCSCTTPNTAYASGTTAADDHSAAYVVVFRDPASFTQPKSYGFSVRAVRGGEL
jgi:hypothetical protein